MSRFHLHLHVADLDQSVGFYRCHFSAPPREGAGWGRVATQGATSCCCTRSIKPRTTSCC